MRVPLRNKRMLRESVGQVIGVAFFLVSFFLATQKEVTRLQAKPNLKITSN
jgi:hypothetical protein